MDYVVFSFVRIIFAETELWTIHISACNRPDYERFEPIFDIIFANWTQEFNSIWYGDDPKVMHTWHGHGPKSIISIITMHTNQLVESYRITSIDHKLSWLLFFVSWWENERFCGRISHFIRNFVPLISTNETDTAHKLDTIFRTRAIYDASILAYDSLNTLHQSKIEVLDWKKSDYCIAGEIDLFVTHLAPLYP